LKETLMRTRLVAMLAWAMAAGCSRASSSQASDDETARRVSPPAGSPGLGEVMVQVGRRFEVAGKAASAGRFELAAFEVGELEELFETEVPIATLPKEGPVAQIPALANAFRQSIPPELARALASRDPAAFATAFQHAAATCNACHVSAEKGFIQVPSVPGQSVPVLDPVPPPGDR
jgi:hypothetical protein